MNIIEEALDYNRKKQEKAKQKEMNLMLKKASFAKEREEKAIAMDRIIDEIKIHPKTYGIKAEIYVKDQDNYIVTISRYRHDKFHIKLEYQKYTRYKEEEGYYFILERQGKTFKIRKNQDLRTAVMQMIAAELETL